MSTNQPFATVPDLSVSLAGISLKNPVMTASGTFGYGIEFMPLMDLDHLGGIVVKGLSLQPSPGNPPPRIVETACGMLNAIGLENVGVDHFIRVKLPLLAHLKTPIFANIYGREIEEYAALAARFNDVEQVAGLEVNISCPNVKAGGVAFGTDPKMAANVISRVRAVTQKPVIAKLSPNVTDIKVIAKAAESAGADAISLINTLTGMAIDIETRRPKLANVTGGLSGPAIKPVALRMVWETAGAVDIPVIGIGGIETAQDALEFIIAGATAIEVGTANFINPTASVEIVEGISAYLASHRIKTIADLIGTLETE